MALLTSKQLYATPLWMTMRIPDVGYVKGVKSPLELGIVDPRGRLLSFGGPAESFRRMNAESGHIIVLNSAFRSMPEQASLFARMERQKAARAKDGKTRVVLAARPGFSDHQDAKAIDVKRGRGRDFVTKHGARFGWFATVPSEPWHFVHKGTNG